MTQESHQVDYFYFDDLLTEEEKMVQKTIRDFVKEKAEPIIEDYFMNNKVPVELIPQMAELGLFGMNLQGYGCAGLSNMCYGLTAFEMEKCDSALRSILSVQNSLCMYAIHQFGSEEQKQKWLPRMARGEILGCFGLTEPDFGSNPGGLKTKAVKKGNYYILNGTKMWITSGVISHIGIIWAKDEDNKFVGFIVEKGDGFTAKEMKGKFSLRASDTAELILDNCKVPEENKLPKVQGLKSALMCLNQARYSIAWGTVGAAEKCFETALNYAKTRIQFDKPIAGFQLTQEKLAYMYTEIMKAKLLVYRLARLKDEGKATHFHISVAKRNNCEMALNIARMAREILAANGIINEYPVFRHMCNLESVKTYEGTHEIHTLIIGDELTGIPAYR